MLGEAVVADRCEVLSTAWAQGAYIGTDPLTNIPFLQVDIPSAQTTGGMKFGYIIPPGTDPNNEYIGLIQGAKANGTGWTGFSHNGAMTGSLLLLAWANGNDMVTSFRYATGYVAPDIYTGNATLTQLAHSVNSTHFSFVYRCENCFAWDQGGSISSNPPTPGAYQVFGWVQSFESPATPASSDSVIQQHDNGIGEFGVPVDSAVASSYSAYLTSLQAKATTSVGPSKTASVTGTITSSSTPSAAPSSTSYSHAPLPTKSYDYIVVGGGAGGIPLADKLSESGKSVLLLERGPPSSYRWGGRNRPTWLDNNNLTRYDVPGLCNEIWVDSAGIACSDVDHMAGCILGGGTAINAGLWWKSPDIDWDYTFPTGWKSADMAPAVSRVFSRIPGTYTPSLDNQIYYPQGYNLLSNALENAGWANVTANSQPNLKNRTFSHTPYMFSHGERGGPMATYLVTASARSNFHLQMNSTVTRVIRTGSHITGVEVQAYGDGGYNGVINVTANTGRVILSAGAFGTPKILFRSGIGPADQLSVVQKSASDAATMIGSANWINLPVGYNLDDHTDTDMVISHPSVVFYDFYNAFNTPFANDSTAYLNKRTGILAQAAPNIGPMFWDEIAGADGITRQLQYTARVEGSLGAPDGNTMTISQYLGRGSISRGRLTINPDLSMAVSTLPYLHNQDDINAVISGIQHVMDALNKVPDLTFVSPAPGQSAADYVNSYVVDKNRGANHWMGSAKIGTDDGRYNNGTAVVDLNTRVYGTDNLFVVDASIFPGEMTTNPSAFIVAVAEQAAVKIQALSTATVAKVGSPYTLLS